MKLIVNLLFRRKHCKKTKRVKKRKEEPGKRDGGINTLDPMLPSPLTIVGRILLSILYICNPYVIVLFKTRLFNCVETTTLVPFLRLGVAYIERKRFFFLFCVALSYVHVRVCTYVAPQANCYCYLMCSYEFMCHMCCIVCTVQYSTYGITIITSFHYWKKKILSVIILLIVVASIRPFL